MSQSAERRQPSAPVVLRRNVAASLVSFGGFYFRNCVDDAISLRACGRSQFLPRSRLFATLTDVKNALLSQIELRYLDAAGGPCALKLDAHESTAVRDGLAISARVEHALGGTIVRASIANRGADAVRLTS